MAYCATPIAYYGLIKAPLAVQNTISLDVAELDALHTRF